METTDQRDYGKLPPSYYFVEKLLKKRKNKYLVKWADFPDSSNTWEPRSSFSSKLLADFERKNRIRKVGGKVRNTVTKLAKRNMNEPPELKMETGAAIIRHTFPGERPPVLKPMIPGASVESNTVSGFVDEIVPKVDAPAAENTQTIPDCHPGPTNVISMSTMMVPKLDDVSIVSTYDPSMQLSTASGVDNLPALICQVPALSGFVDNLPLTTVEIEIFNDPNLMQQLEEFAMTATSPTTGTTADEPGIPSSEVNRVIRRWYYPNPDKLLPSH